MKAEEKLDKLYDQIDIERKKENELPKVKAGR